MHWETPVAQPCSLARRNFIVMPKRSSCEMGETEVDVEKDNDLAAVRIACFKQMRLLSGEVGPFSCADASCHASATARGQSGSAMGVLSSGARLGRARRKLTALWWESLGHHSKAAQAR